MGGWGVWVDRIDEMYEIDGWVADEQYIHMYTYTDRSRDG